METQNPLHQMAKDRVSFVRSGSTTVKAEETTNFVAIPSIEPSGRMHFVTRQYSFHGHSAVLGANALSLAAPQLDSSSALESTVGAIVSGTSFSNVFHVPLRDDLDDGTTTVVRDQEARLTAVTAQLVRDAGATIARLGLIAADEEADALFAELLKKYSPRTKSRRITKTP